MLFEYLFRNISMFGWSDPDPDPDRAPRLAHLLINTQSDARDRARHQELCDVHHVVLTSLGKARKFLFR